MDYIKHIHEKIITDSNKLNQILSSWHSAGNKIVFTNGCFDILHRGHVEYLAKAAMLGDKLIVALNTDRSIKQLKGENRPINDEIARATVIGALEFVDLVLFFDQETPYDIIAHIKPNVLVKGADYKPENIVGYDIVTQNGGEVVTIDFVTGYSTTLTLKKLNQ